MLEVKKKMNKHAKNIEEVATQSNIPDSAPDSTEITENLISESKGAKESPKTKKPKERSGALLKRARESQRLSLEMVHEATKIPMDALRAIEEGYTVRVLSSFYYNGFVKMYANYLNVNVSEVIEDYKPEELPQHIAKEVEEFEIPKWITEIFTRKRRQQLIMALGGLLTLFVFFKLVGLLILTRPSAPVPKKANIIEAVKKEIKKVDSDSSQKVQPQPPKIIAPNMAPKVVTKPIPPQPIQPAASVAPAVTVQKEISLTVRATQNSWLLVKTDGITVFQSTLRIGDVESWFANNEIEISGRNISQLEFELNGKMIGKLGRNDRNTKKVIITKNGLSVK
jgi:cytoskeletal protein RodZ